MKSAGFQTRILIDGGLFFGKRRSRFPKKGSNRARFVKCVSEDAVPRKMILVHLRSAQKQGTAGKRPAAFRGGPLTVKRGADRTGGKEDSVKGTQEGFLSRQINLPAPQGHFLAAMRLGHSDRFRPTAEICLSLSKTFWFFDKLRGGHSPPLQNSPSSLPSIPLPDRLILQSVKLLHARLHRRAAQQLPHDQTGIPPLLHLHPRIGAQHIDPLLNPVAEGL